MRLEKGRGRFRMGNYVWGNRRGMYDEEIKGAKKSKEMSNKNKILLFIFQKVNTTRCFITPSFTKMFKIVPC